MTEHVEAPEDPDATVLQSRREGWLNDVAASLTETKVREWLRQKAVVTESAAPPAA